MRRIAEAHTTPAKLPENELHPLLQKDALGVGQ
jgi:hypothetical protein